MVEMTVQVSEELAKRLQPIGPWLPTVLELSEDTALAVSGRGHWQGTGMPGGIFESCDPVGSRLK